MVSYVHTVLYLSFLMSDIIIIILDTLVNYNSNVSAAIFYRC